MQESSEKGGKNIKIIKHVFTFETEEYGDRKCYNHYKDRACGCQNFNDSSSITLS